MPWGKRNSRALVESRVLELLPLVSMMTEKDLLQYVANKGWNVSKRTVENYIAKARKILQEEASKFKENALNNVLNNYIKLYQKALKNSDIKSCVSIQKEIANLHGLNQKLDVTTGGDKITNFKVVIDDKLNGIKE